MIRAIGEDEVFEGLPRQARLVSVDLVSRTRQVHERGNLAEAALASVRLPVLFAPMPQDDGRLLIDGGVLDNLPVDLLTARAEGPVVAVNIGTGGEGTVRRGRPRVPALGETLLRTMMIGSGGAVAAARAAGRLGAQPELDGRRTAGVPPARPDDRRRPRSRRASCSRPPRATCTTRRPSNRTRRGRRTRHCGAGGRLTVELSSACASPAASG